MFISTLGFAQYNNPGSTHNWDSTSLSNTTKKIIYNNYISDSNPDDRYPYINIIINNLVSSDSISIYNVIETGDTILQSCRIDSVDLSKQLFTGYTGRLSLQIKNNNMHAILVKMLNRNTITGLRKLICRRIRYYDIR